jgi:hypothetical protein
VNGLELTFFIKQQNTALLESTLLDVSDPDSTNYGKHLTNQQVCEVRILGSASSLPPSFY